jgi:hypothetical protein
MAITQIWGPSRASVSDGRAAAPSRRRGRQHWAYLWVLLRAPALLDGTAETGGLPLLEDDGRRLARTRRAN